MLFKIFYRHVYSLRCHLLGLLRLCLLQPSTQSHSLHKVMVLLITQLVRLPFTSIAELLHQSEGNIFITAQSFVKLYQLLHPRTIPTSTVAMLLVLKLYIYNNHCILTIDYIPYYIAKELRLFQKIDSERNLIFIFNCYQVEFRQLFHFTQAKCQTFMELSASGTDNSCTICCTMQGIIDMNRNGNFCTGT